MKVASREIQESDDAADINSMLTGWSFPSNIDLWMTSRPELKIWRRSTLYFGKQRQIMVKFFISSPPPSPSKMDGDHLVAESSHLCESRGPSSDHSFLVALFWELGWITNLKLENFPGVWMVMVKACGSMFWPKLTSDALLWSIESQSLFSVRLCSICKGGVLVINTWM